MRGEPPSEEMFWPDFKFGEFGLPLFMLLCLGGAGGLLIWVYPNPEGRAVETAVIASLLGAVLYAVCLRFVPALIARRGSGFRFTDFGVTRIEKGAEAWQLSWDHVTLVIRNRKLINDHPRTAALTILDQDRKERGTLHWNEGEECGEFSAHRHLSQFIAHRTDRFAEDDRPAFGKPGPLLILAGSLALVGGVLLAAQIVLAIEPEVQFVRSLGPASPAKFVLGIVLVGLSWITKSFLSGAPEHTAKIAAEIATLASEPRPPRIELLPGQWYQHRDRRKFPEKRLNLLTHWIVPIAFVLPSVLREAQRLVSEQVLTWNTWALAVLLLPLWILFAKWRRIAGQAAYIMSDGDQMSVVYKNKTRHFPSVPAVYATQPYGQDVFVSGRRRFALEPYFLEKVSASQVFGGRPTATDGHTDEQKGHPPRQEDGP